MKEEEGSETEPGELRLAQCVSFNSQGPVTGPSDEANDHLQCWFQALH